MYDFLSNKSHIPNNPLREDILEAANKYISKVYINDDGPNFLAIDRNNLTVRLTDAKFPPDSQHDWSYYEAVSVVKPVPNSLEIEPDQLAIDAITLDFFPIERLDNFRSSAKSAIARFISEKGLANDALISFPIDTFTVEVIESGEHEAIDTADLATEGPDDILDAAKWIEIPLKEYVRMRGDKVIINEIKLLKVAIDNFY